MNIILVDDHEPTRKQIASVIGKQEDMTVVAQVATGEDSLSKVTELKPDVVVMDILLPGMNGVETSRHIVASCPDTRILVLSNYSGESLVQTVLDTGVLGYVRKDHAFEELVPALRSVAAGRRYVGEKVDES